MPDELHASDVMRLTVATRPPSYTVSVADPAAGGAARRGRAGEPVGVGASGVGAVYRRRGRIMNHLSIVGTFAARGWVPRNVITWAGRPVHSCQISMQPPTLGPLVARAIPGARMLGVPRRAGRGAGAWPIGSPPTGLAGEVARWRRGR